MLDSEVHYSVMSIGQHIEQSGNAFLSFRKRNQRIDLKGDNAVCYITRGSVSVYRQDNHLLMMTLEAPTILGLAQMTDGMKHHYLRCDTDCEMWATGTRDTVDIFNAHNLWKHACNLLNWHLRLYFQRDIMMTHRFSYDMIDEHLKCIWSLSPEVREKTSVYSFIMARNHISRSGIHKVLHTMMESGSIKVDRGKLVYYRGTEHSA